MKKNYLIKVPLKESPSTILIGKNILKKFKKKFLMKLKIQKKYLL